MFLSIIQTKVTTQNWSVCVQGSFAPIRLKLSWFVASYSPGLLWKYLRNWLIFDVCGSRQSDQSVPKCVKNDSFLPDWEGAFAREWPWNGPQLTQHVLNERRKNQCKRTIFALCRSNETIQVRWKCRVEDNDDNDNNVFIGWKYCKDIVLQRNYVVGLLTNQIRPAQWRHWVLRWA